MSALSQVLSPQSQVTDDACQLLQAAAPYLAVLNHTQCAGDAEPRIQSSSVAAVNLTPRAVG